MINFLEKTLGFMKDQHLKEQDVLWVGNSKVWCDWDVFKQHANFDYDDGYGGNEISLGLMIVFRDSSEDDGCCWMERYEYDGKEWWELKREPARPSKKLVKDSQLIENMIKEG